MKNSLLKLRIVLGPVAGLCLVACHRQPEPPSPTPLPAAVVKVQTVQRRIEPVREEVVGTVRAKTRATLEAKIAGRIAELSVFPGQAVREGERLARLDAQEWQARHEQAVAAHDQASRDLDRYRELLKRQAVTQSEYDAMAARFGITEAGVREARTMMGYTEVKAPFAGVIARKWAEAGDLAVPGRPLLELEDPATLELEAHVPESLLPFLSLGLTCRVEVVTLPDPLAGKVAELSPAGDPKSRTFLVKFDLPAQAGLRSGLFGRVSIPAGTNQVVQVARSALRVRGQLEYVFVVTNQTARLRLVKAGRQRDGEVELLSGVEPAERVVVGGGEALTDGQPVKEQGPN